MVVNMKLDEKLWIYRIMLLKASLYNAKQSNYQRDELKKVYFL